jgi:hypothetical protein
LSGTLPAGRAPVASAVNRLQPTTYQATQTGNGGGQQALSTTEADCLGCSVTFSVATLATCVVQGTFDFDVTATGSTVGVGKLYVDGSLVTGGREAHIGGNSVTRATPGQCWQFTFAATGSHTLKLRCVKTAAAATINLVDNHTSMVITVYEVVS